MHRLDRVYFLALLNGLTLLIALTALLLVSLYQSPVVTFDKDRLVKQFVTQLSQKPLSVEKADSLSSRFAKALKESLDEYATNNKTIVIKKEMVLASNQDITKLIATTVAAKMRSKP